VKLFTRGLALVILSLGMFVLVGCGTDNETEAEKLAKTIGDPGPPVLKGAPEAPAPPTTEADRAKQIVDTQKAMRKGGGGPKR
jgi:hypothetical protein